MTKKASIAHIAGQEERIAEFASKCIAICDMLPRGRAGASNFKDQLARSATSVAANYAEATVPSSQRDFAGRLTIALKELAESRMHLSIIARLGYHRKLTKDMMDALVDEADAIAAILNRPFKIERSKPAGAAMRKAKNGKVSIAGLLREADAEPRKMPGRKKKKSSPAKTADDSGASAEPPKKRGRGRPRKEKPESKAPRKRKPSPRKKTRKAAKPPKKNERGMVAPVQAETRALSTQRSETPLQALMAAFTLQRALPPPPRRQLLACLPKKSPGQ